MEELKNISQVIRELRDYQRTPEAKICGYLEQILIRIEMIRIQNEEILIRSEPIN